MNRGIRMTRQETLLSESFIDGKAISETMEYLRINGEGIGYKEIMLVRLVQWGRLAGGTYSKRRLSS